MDIVEMEGKEPVLRAITMDSVESSQIYGIGHDADSNTLAVRFKSKAGLPAALYEYANFTIEDFAAFKAAPSIGSYFYKNIKPFPERYPFACIEKLPAPVQQDPV